MSWYEPTYRAFLATFEKDPANAGVVVFECHGWVEEPFANLSNFRPSPLVLDGHEWGSVNHYFQAAKFAGTDDAWKEAIRQAPDPFEASRLGKSREHPIQANWDQSRNIAMKRALTAKFEQNEALRQLLLSTKEAPILCHNPHDGWWGDGVGCGGSHQNYLGKLLMEVRSALQR